MNEATSGARIAITPPAAALLEHLTQRYGPVLFHQSGGCCDGGRPLCLRQSEFRIGARDVLLDVVQGTPFYVDEFHFQFLSNDQLILDAVPSTGDSFSLESSEEMRFVSRPMCVPR